MKRGWIKGICAVLCVLLLNAGVWGCAFFALWKLELSADGNFYHSSLYYRTVNDYIDLAEEILTRESEAAQGELSGYDRQRLLELTEMLDEKNTNFRFAAYRTADMTLLCANAGEKEQWRDEVYDTNIRVRDFYSYEDGGQTRCSISYGVAWPMTVEDDFWKQAALYDTIGQTAPLVLALSIACCVAGIILLILLMCFAGRRPGREDVALNLQDRIPYDLYLFVQIVLNCVVWGLLFIEGVNYLSCYGDLTGVLWVAGAGLGGSVLVLAFLLTTVTRIKARTIFRNTVIWWLCKWIWRGIKRACARIGAAFGAIPLIWKAALVCGGYLLLGLILAQCSLFLWFVLTVALLAYVCWWVLQWKRIRMGTEKIIGGDPGYRIDSGKMPPDLKQHANELNNLGQAISAAVDERMKSEHFKAELITNVSHDLKTPLTSIINYVDLLKKEEIDNPKAQEYIEVLDRKSQRLKKLTEDLVEASKASTGALTVNRERLDLVQLIRQAQGEYEERLSAAGLSLVLTLPEREMIVNGDGRHMWRILDNLLGNCAKYAMEGTRVYLDLTPWDGNAVITVKNISRNPLNMPAEQLMERFVRGDESRTTEGSGLGLSIARSLTELQGGRFLLDIDGDLFKAKIILPLDEA